MTKTQEVKDIIAECRQALRSEHIRAAAVLRDGHPLRKLVALAAVPSFLRRYTKGSFPYQEEVQEVDGFAQDLLKAVSETLVADNLTVPDKAGAPTIRTSIFVEDPIAKAKYCPWPA